MDSTAKKAIYSKEALIEARQQKAVAQDALLYETKRKETLEDLSVDKARFTKTEEALSLAPSLVDALTAEKKKMASLTAKARGVKSLLNDFEAAEKDCERMLYEAHVLAESHYYSEAKETLDGLKKYFSLDYGFPLFFVANLKEIYAWSNFSLALKEQLYVHVAKKEPWDKNTLLSLIEDAKFLPVSFHSEDQRKNALNQVFGLAVSLFNGAPTPTNAKDLSEELNLCLDWKTNGTEKDEDINASFSELHEKLLGSFNALSLPFEDKDADFNAALALFQLRTNFSAESLSSAMFRLPKDEKEFSLCFYLNKLEKNDFPFFEKYLLEMDAQVKQDNADAKKLYSSLLVDEALEKEKTELLNSYFDHYSFSQKLDMLAESLNRGAKDELASTLFASLVRTKKKRIDLENKAAVLAILREKLPEKERGNWEKLRGGLLRSPKAKRVIRKSNSPILHDLQKPGAKFLPPIGNKSKNTFVNYWGKDQLAVYWLLILGLPVLVAVCACIALHSYLLTDFYFPFYLLAPILLVEIMIIVIVYQHAGRDERFSAYARRIFALVGLVIGGLSLAYFISPGSLSAFQPYGYTLIIIGAADLLIAELFFRDFHKRWDFILCLPLFLVEVASLVFLILRLMGK